ncbi:MAG: DUF2817 domain-containing protein, partial [Flavobacterium sp.]
MDFRSISDIYKAPALGSRYIALSDIEPLLRDAKGEVSVFGESVEKRPLYQYRIGHGPFRILMWSQMHGNESTATRALFDLFAFLESDQKTANDWLERFTFCFVPMLNPDGALRYTRENANGVDLNRDFVQLTQPESTALFQLFEDFHPNFCFNLHDQRSIFGVGDTGMPASISLLAPAFNAEREVNQTRGLAIKVAVAINTFLQDS